MKKIKQLLLVLFVTVIGLFATGCKSCNTDSSVEEVEPFTFRTEVPAEAGIYDEIYFRSYFKQIDDAEYNLYVSYYDTFNGVQVTERKLSSLIFICEQETVYTFKIERIIDGKSEYLTCTITVLPEEPAFTDPRTFSVPCGETRTVTELINLSQMIVTPSNLAESVALTTMDFDSYVVGVEDMDDVDVSTLTEYTFDKEGVYTFDVSVSNASGTATATITVNTYNQDYYAQKLELSYAPIEKMLSWNALNGATAYQVTVGDNEAVEVTEAQYAFDSYEDGEYEVSVVPVYNGVIYENSQVNKLLAVGRVKTPLRLSAEMDTITWAERYFVEKYVVTEGEEEYEYTAETLYHTLKGDYSVNEEVTVTVVGYFDDGTQTEEAEITLIYGAVGAITLNKIDAKAGIATDVEYVAFDGFDGNTWFMAEWVGKNAPNYGVRVKDLTSTWDGSYSIKDPAGEYTPGGMLLCNSSERSWTNMAVYRGYNTSSNVRGDAGDGVNLGIYRYKEDTHYIQIAGYEIIEDSETKNARIISYLFTVDESGTLTLVSKSEGQATWATHVLGGTHAVYYGNIGVVGVEGNPDSVTFKYAKPANNINSLLYNINDNYAYKAQLIELVGATEPDAESNFIPKPIYSWDIVEAEPEIPDIPEDAEPLSDEVTLNKVGATAGVTADGSTVEFIEFDGFDGATWFMVDFVGKNAPNYAVRALQGYATWTSELASMTTEVEGYTGAFTPAGMLLVNSWEAAGRGLAVYRGLNTSSTGTRRAWFGDGATTGMERFVDGQRYIQIVGYVPNEDGYGATFYTYVFVVSENGALTLIDKATATDTHSANALRGSKAVIYGNISHGGDSVTFTYATPAESIEELINNLHDKYAYKAILKDLLEIGETPVQPDQPTEPDDSTSSDDSNIPDDSTSSDDSSIPDDSTSSDDSNIPDDSTSSDDSSIPDDSTSSDASSIPDDSSSSDDSQDSSGSDDFVESALTQVTLNRTDATAGVTAEGETVEFVEFDGFNGATWFMVEFEGQNAPNYAVRAWQGYSVWDESTTTTAWYSPAQASITTSGMLICNAWESNHNGIAVYRGTDTSASGSRRAWTDDTVSGMNRYEAGKKYIQIIGYEPAEDGYGATFTVYTFIVGEDGSLTKYSDVKTDTHSANALGGSKAVIYANINRGPESITFKYATPATTLANLVNNVDDSYEYKTALKSSLNLTETEEPENPVEPEEPIDPEQPEEPVESALTQVTLNRTDATAGVTAEGETVEFVEFDGFSGATWFMVEFEGQNAPNYAVRAWQGYSVWDESTTATAWYSPAQASITTSGMLICNTWEAHWTAVAVYRGTNTSASGSRRAWPDDTASGMSRYEAGKKYIQIIGYEPAEDGYGATFTTYTFVVGEDGTLAMYTATATDTHSANALGGSKAVIYANINRGPENITFKYATPATTLADLVNNVDDSYEYKTALKSSLEIE